MAVCHNGSWRAVVVAARAHLTSHRDIYDLRHLTRELNKIEEVFREMMLSSGMADNNKKV